MATQGSANPANPAPRPTANGNSAGNMAMPQQRNNDGQMGASSTAQNPSMSQQNLNGIVSIKTSILLIVSHSRYTPYFI